MRTILLTLVLLISAVSLQAQEGSPGLDSWQPLDRTAGVTTIEGCLQTYGSHFTLTDHSGRVQQLSLQANKLGSQVGREVEITGKPGLKTIDTTESEIASSATELPVFEVRSVKRIADTCK